LNFQRLGFKINDNDLKGHDSMGQAWLALDDYVAKGEKYTLLLPEKGYDYCYA